MATTEVVKDNGVDPADVPSAKWGWSKESPRVLHILGLVITGFLLLMLRGNHVGKVEDLFLIGFAAIVLAFTVNDFFGRRSGRIR